MARQAFPKGGVPPEIRDWLRNPAGEERRFPASERLARAYDGAWFQPEKRFAALKVRGDPLEVGAKAPADD